MARGDDESNEEGEGEGDELVPSEEPSELHDRMNGRNSRMSAVW